MAAATAATASVVLDKKEAIGTNVPTEQKVGVKDAQELLNACPKPLNCAVYGDNVITHLGVYTGSEHVVIKPKVTNVKQEAICCVYNAHLQLVPSYTRFVEWQSPELFVSMEPASAKRLYPAVSENGFLVLTTWDYQFLT